MTPEFSIHGTGWQPVLLGASPSYCHARHIVVLRGAFDAENRRFGRSSSTEFDQGVPNPILRLLSLSGGINVYMIESIERSAAVIRFSSLESRWSRTLPRSRYSFKTDVAHLLNKTPLREFTRYPTEIIISRL